MGAWLRNARPYLMLLAVQFGSAGMFIFAMDAIKKGMSHYVFIVYRNAIASITLAPFAFVLERYLPLCFFNKYFLTHFHLYIFSSNIVYYAGKFGQRWVFAYFQRLWHWLSSSNHYLLHLQIYMKFKFEIFSYMVLLAG